MNRQELLRVVNVPLGICLALALIACSLLAITISRTSSPVIDQQYGDTRISISADRGWTLLPGDCVQLAWQLEGIQSLYIEREGKIGWGEMSFCPAINASSPRIEVRAQNGLYRRFHLEIKHLPDLLFYLAGFVGVVGAFPLAGYFLWAYRLDRPTPLVWMSIGALLLALVGGWLRLQPAAAPAVDEDQGDVAVRFWAERARIVLPHECVDIWWSVVGAESLAVNGRNMSHSKDLGTIEHCAADGDLATLEAVADDGKRSIHPISIRTYGSIAGLTAPFFYWSVFGILLAAVVFLPLIAEAVREQWRSSRSFTDLAAVAGCAFLVILLYLPFGIDSSGHREEWHVFSYFEGSPPTAFASEYISRFFVVVPHTLAYLISSDSFLGYHLVHLLLHTSKLVIFYGILRQLRLSPLYAFLITVLVLVYPVNSALMSLRSLPMNFSMMSLLAAVYIVMDYIRRPRRLALLGLWLALLFNVASNESGYAVILILPLLWWLRCRKQVWRNLSLTVIWYLAPAFKIAYILLLMLSGREYYRGPGLSESAQAADAAAGILGIFSQVMRDVYVNTFINGWQDALAALDENRWWPTTFVMLAGVLAVAWYLSRSRANTVELSFRQAGALFLSGLLFIVPAVGILMWIPYYRGDPWRMYFYAPIGASVALVSALILLTSPIRRRDLRRAAVIAVCLLLMLPAASRLLLQHGKYIESAFNKARVMYRVIERAPTVEPAAQLAIVTDMSLSELSHLGIFEFVHQKMINSAFYVLYGHARPESVRFCLSASACGFSDLEPTTGDTGESVNALSRTLVFRLNQDLTVDLIEDPLTFLGLDTDIDYDASELYNPDAPLPPRATTMLGVALRG